MKYIFLSLLMVGSLLASETSEYESNEWKETLCFELADWHDHDLEDLSKCIESIKLIQTTNLDNGAVDLEIEAHLDPQENALNAHFVIQDGYVTYMYK